MDQDVFVLENKRLRVNIMKPGTGYRGSRYDWTGFIMQVLLDGKHTFCTSESLIAGKGCGGRGLSNEFGIFAPIGYDEVLPGGKFPKLGIGLLTRQDAGNYLFYGAYKVQPFHVGISKDSTWIRFVIEPMACNGYAARLEKLIRLEDNYLVIEYHLCNAGSKRIITHEYAHNFISINGHSVGPDYQLRFPYRIVTEESCPILSIADHTLSWKENPRRDFYCRLKDFSCSNGHYWELVHKPSGIGIREYSDFDVSIIALWGSAHVISPEIFVDIDLKPGESYFWTRKYEFFY